MEGEKAIDNKVTEMVELSAKDFKAAIIKIFHWAIKNMLDTNGKIETSVNK